MNRFAGLTAVFLICASIVVASHAQGPAQLPDTRQHDIEQLALTLYATHLDDGSWTRRDAEPCARMPHHRFAIFTQTPTDGVIARFFVVYHLEAPPSHSAKPWQRGVQLIRLRARSAKSLDQGPSDPNLVAIFNRVLEDEHAAGPGMAPAARMNIDDLADCFLAVTGEHRIPVVRSSAAQSQQAAAPVVGGPVTGIMVPLVTQVGYTRTANLRLDDHGLLITADILVQYTAR